MAENEKLNIQRARAALAEGKQKDAKAYYQKALDENTGNAEAAFWVLAIGWRDRINSQGNADAMREAFTTMSDALVDTAEQLAAPENIGAEKGAILAAAVNAYLPIADYVVRQGESIAGPESRIQYAALTFYGTGNAIERNFASNPQAMAAACTTWKEGVKLQRKFYAYSYDGNKAEVYVEKIQKIEPDYVMPNKPGCISLA